MTKNIISGIVTGVVGVIIGLVLSLVFTPQASVQGVSSSGSSFSTRKTASVTISPSSLSATSTAILNTDATDRLVTDGFAACTSVASQPAVSTWILQAATTSAATGAFTNTSYALNISIATTSAIAYTASSSYGFDAYRYWATGTYMTFMFNASNTAACTVGVNYVPL